MRILVVDDEPAVREALERALRLDGYEVALAGDGREALRSRPTAPADAVVLDVLMPGLDGLEVCRRMRDAGDRTPVLMLTARDEVGDRVAGLDAGADDYLSKPFALEELLARVRALLRRVGLERRATRCCASPTSSSTRSRHEVAPRRAADRADPHRVPAARAVPAPPAPGAHPRGRSSSACGATTSARPRTRSRSTSATCAARPRRRASRGCCTPCAASATSCGHRGHELPPAHRRCSPRRAVAVAVVLGRGRRPTSSCATSCASSVDASLRELRPKVVFVSRATARRRPARPARRPSAPVTFQAQLPPTAVGGSAGGRAGDAAPTATSSAPRRAAAARRPRRVREVAAGRRGAFLSDATVGGVHVRVLTARGPDGSRCRSPGR